MLIYLIRVGKSAAAKIMSFGVMTALAVMGQPCVNIVYLIPGPSTIDSLTVPAILISIISLSFLHYPIYYSLIRAKKQ